MSIFVSIPSLVDPELPYTVMSAVQNADNPKNIIVGVAAFVDKNFYNDLLYKINGFNNVIIDRYDPEENTGIGKARLLAQHKYSGEDYFLQCDSHTYFEKGWDTKLAALWQEALEETKNEKTLLTGYPSGYMRRDGNLYIKNSMARYSTFQERDDLPFYSFIPWTDMPLSDFPYKVEKKFVPAQKISGCFVFSNHHFAENSGHNENMKFLDEEIIQSIDLFSRGFSLVFPNTNIPIHHYYYVDLHDRLRQVGRWTGKEMDHSMNTYMKENQWRCREWEQYAKVNIAGRSFKDWYIPKNYR